VNGVELRLADCTLMLHCCVRRLSVVCTECIVAKRCVLEQKLVLTACRKSHMRNRLVPKRMPVAHITYTVLCVNVKPCSINQQNELTLTFV